MDCPSCSGQLKPTKLEADLPAMHCIDCDGSLVSLLIYRAWSERYPQQIESTPETINEELDVAESKQGLLCPKCRRIMQKFAISAESEHKIDLCSFCDEAWLDQGEWRLLKQLELADKLSTIITAPWQYKIKKAVFEQKNEQRWLDKLGEADFGEASKIRDWLLQHPKADELLRFLNEKPES